MVLSKLKFTTFAHRGASKLAPENTLVAFKTAKDLGCRAVEFDVRLSSDGQLLIFHDDTLNRTTNGSGKFIEHSYEQLRQLDAGRWFNTDFSGEKIPSLIEVIDLFKETNTLLNVELKPDEGFELKLAERVLEELAPFLDAGNPPILFSSFKFDAIKAISKQRPDAAIGLLLDDWRPDWQELCNELNAVSVHLNKKIVTKQRVEDIHDTNRRVYVFTVDDSALASKLLHDDMVDAIFTNVPDKLGAAKS